MDEPVFDPWLTCWRLKPDGAPIATASARLLPVRRNDVPAMLRVSLEEDAGDAAALLAWWRGDGAVQVLEAAGAALLLERATTTGSLAAMARAGRDADACRVLCEIAARLHRNGRTAPPGLIPLDVWFRDLPPAAARHGGVLAHSAQVAQRLLASGKTGIPLHGDLHHGNVLDFGSRGWLAIDPKGLIGERGFDYAALFLNPDLITPDPPLALHAATFTRRLALVVAASALARDRLLQWVLAGAGLSAAWLLDDDDPRAAIPLRIASLAAMELGLEIAG